MVLSGYQNDCEYVSGLTNTCDGASNFPICLGFDYSAESGTSCCIERQCKYSKGYMGDKIRRDTLVNACKSSG